MMQNLFTFVVVAVVGVARHIIQQPVRASYSDPDVRTKRGKIRMHQPLAANVHNMWRHLTISLEVIVLIKISTYRKSH